MKKLFIFVSVILVFTMLFTACGSKAAEQPKAQGCNI